MGIEERGAAVAALGSCCCFAVGVMQAIIWRKEALIPGEIYGDSDEIRERVRPHISWGFLRQLGRGRVRERPQGRAPDTSSQTWLFESCQAFPSAAWVEVLEK